MQIFFASRSQARAFAKGKTQGKAVDNGTNAPKRWGFKIEKKA